MTDSTIHHEIPIAFECGDDALLGIIHRGVDESPVGVIVVVAGTIDKGANTFCQADCLDVAVTAIAISAAFIE